MPDGIHMISPHGPLMSESIPLNINRHPDAESSLACCGCITDVWQTHPQNSMHTKPNSRIAIPQCPSANAGDVALYVVWFGLINWTGPVPFSKAPVDVPCQVVPP